MTHTQEHIDALKDIRSMMKKSTRFLSLSGLSGVFAGCYAIAGAFVAAGLLDNFSYDYGKAILDRYSHADAVVSNHSEPVPGVPQPVLDIYFKLFLDAFIVLVLSIGTGFFFSYRKAKKNGETLFDATALRLFFNLIIPLAAGGIFSLILLDQGNVALIAPVMLLFYGMALLNASKYTFDDIRYLGISEMILGIISAWYLNHGLLFWVVGFGVLHIMYGLVMWMKYEKGK